MSYSIKYKALDALKSNEELYDKVRTIISESVNRIDGETGWSNEVGRTDTRWQFMTESTKVDVAAAQFNSVRHVFIIDLEVMTVQKCGTLAKNEPVNKFSNKQLKFFDELGFETSEVQQRQTNQHITDWWNK